MFSRPTRSGEGAAAIGLIDPWSRPDEIRVLGFQPIAASAAGAATIALAARHRIAISNRGVKANHRAAIVERCPDEAADRRRVGPFALRLDHAARFPSFVHRSGLCHHAFDVAG
jgi:hypothetical protein